LTASKHRTQTNLSPQSNVAAVKPSTKASTKSQRLYLAAKRIKAAFSHVLFSSLHSSKTTKHRTLKNGPWKSCSPNKPSQNLVRPATSSRTSASAHGPSASSGRRRRTKPALLPLRRMERSAQARNPSSLQSSLSVGESCHSWLTGTKESRAKILGLNRRLESFLEVISCLILAHFWREWTEQDGSQQEASRPMVSLSCLSKQVAKLIGRLFIGLFHSLSRSYYLLHEIMQLLPHLNLGVHYVQGRDPARSCA
jgi:hypothetical protein